MSKAKLRSRLIDILYGAGIRYWKDEDIEYFGDGPLECTGRAIYAIEMAFNIPRPKSLFRLPWNLGKLSTLDGYVDLLVWSLEQCEE